MRKLRLFLSCAMLFVVGYLAYAQNIAVSGTVTDAATGEGVPFASIQVKGTMTGTSTDADGNYTISVPKNAILIFSSIGYLNQEAAVEGRTVVNILLAPDTEALEEAVITIAYGAAKRSSLTGAIASVNSEQLEMRPVSAVTSALEGTVSGVQVNSTYGAPGSDPSILIRGNGTINGSSTPLYVIDGVPFGGNLSDLNPNDIESLSVLKDAASAALYGNRASNGVILITTKKGKAGRLSVTASANQGTYARGIKEYPRAEANEFMEAHWLELRNRRLVGNNDVTASQIIEAFSNPQTVQAANDYATRNIIPDKLYLNIYNVADDALFDANGKLVPNASIRPGYIGDLNWFDQAVSPGFRQDYNVNASGASDNSDYYFSLGYLDEKGYLKTATFDRFSGRAAVNVKPTSYMKLGLNVNATHQNFTNTSDGTNSIVNPFKFCREISPIYPVHLHDKLTGEYILDANGNKQYDPGSYVDANGVVQTTRNQYPDRHVIWENEINEDISVRNTMNAIATAEFYFLRDFTFTVTGNMNIRHSINSYYDSAVIGDGKGNGGREGRVEYYYRNWTFQQQLRWTRQFGDHSVSVLLGHENFNYYYDYLYGYKTSEVFPGVNNLRNFTEITSLYNYGNNYRTESYLSRVRYNYQDKYNVEASFRRDGSSRFSAQARWGNFWSIGANWMISREDFMQTVGWVNSLKLRADFGQVGNDSGTGYYGYQALYTATQHANQGAYYLSQLGNDLLQWETGQSWGIGIESRLFNRWNLNIEYFDRRNKDLIFDVYQPLSSGATSTSYAEAVVTMNLGTMSNRGVEIETDFDIIRTRDWRFNVSANATFLKNKILTLPEQNRKDGIINGTQRFLEGHDRYEYWLYQFAGVDQMTGQSLYLFDDERYYITSDNTANGTVLFGKASHIDEETKEEVKHTLMDAKNYIIIGDTPYVYNPGSYGKKDWSGTATPTVYGSFGFNLGFKGLTLSSIFTYSLGAKVYDGIYSSLMSVPGNPSSVHRDVLGAWSGIPAGMTENSADRIDPNGIPMMNSAKSYNNSGTTNRWLVSGDYLVLKNIALSYSLPKRWANALEMNAISLNVACENAFTLTHRAGMNPQQRFDGYQAYNYMVTPRVFTAGLTLRF